MTDQILDALTTVLRDSDINAVRVFPFDRFSSSEPHIICVSLHSSRVLPSGFGQYLGTTIDPDSMRESEIFAFRLGLEIALDIYVPLGTHTAPALDLISTALHSLPSGLRIVELRSGDTRFDRDTDMLKSSATLLCSAYMTALADSDSGEFYDFVLKGVLKNDT